LLLFYGGLVVTKKIRTYLSGGMEYAKNEGVDWRTMVEAWIIVELGHSVFNPNSESEKYLKKKLPDSNLRELKFSNTDRFQSIVRGIVKIDSEEIAKRSDYVICYWNRSAQRGAGTKGELTLARFFGKPVYMITRTRRENIPGWILGCTSEIFTSFAELKLFLLRKYLDRR
jgi:hypothetical protein